MFNKAILMGRICNDLELKTIQSGVSVLSFRIAVDRQYQTKGEERKTDFFNIVAWRNTAEFISRYFYKGRMILVEGELQTRQYTDKNGVTQNIVEIVASNAQFTGEKAEQTSSVPAPANVQTQVPVSSPAPIAQPIQTTEQSGEDDDYPF